MRHEGGAAALADRPEPLLRQAGQSERAKPRQAEHASEWDGLHIFASLDAEEVFVA